RFRDSSSSVDLPRFDGFGARVQRRDGASLGDRILPSITGHTLAAHGCREILELACIRVALLDDDLLDRTVGAAQLDPGIAPVPRVVEPQHAARSTHLEL